MPKNRDLAEERFTLRMPKRLYDELFAVIAATEAEVTRTQLIIRAIRFYLHNLRHTPSMLEFYDIERDVSVRQKCKPYDNRK